MNGILKGFGLQSRNGQEVSQAANVSSATVERQRGIGALEWIGIIAVIALLLYQVLSRVGLMNSANSAVAESAAVSAIYTSARSTLKSGAGYGTNGADLLVSLNAVGGIPKSLSYNAGTLLNTYGVAYTLVVANAGYGFTLTDPGLIASDCVKLVVQQSSSGSWTGGISVNGTAVGAAAVTTAAATAACNAVANSVAMTSQT